MTAYYNEFDPHAAAWLRELIKDGLIAPGDVDERSIVDVQPNDLKGYTQCHWFAGIGGWSAALRMAGWRDDRECWTGSCPCQPFSSAGKRKGTEDERHLWPVFFRLIEACQPPIIFGEQVASADVVGKVGGSVEGSPSVWIDGVFDDLEGASYSCGAADFPAASVGAPHIRQRLYWGAARLADAECYSRRTRRISEQSRRSDAEKESGTSIEPGRRGDAGGLGDTAGERFGETWSPFGSEGQSASVPSGAVATGGLEHSPRNGRQQRWAEPNMRGLTKGCSADRIRHAVREGLETVGTEQAGTHSEDGGGFWSDYRIIHCRDGKARRIPAAQSGFQSVVDGLSAGMDGVRLACLDRFPLAGKIPNRVTLLRGAGNAIVPEQAAAFIEAFEESITVLARLQENET